LCGIDYIEGLNYFKMKNRQFKTLVSLLLISTFYLLPFTLNAQVRAIYDNGAAGLGQQLKRLQTTASAMHTAAHPDDEDSGLMAYLARREQARTVYLSLNRGDGGQNVVGEELFEQLGIIRTEELLQARRLDGGEQLFTRVMDYGFSKKREEAARIWGEQLTLGDMVRAIRMYRPLVIISRFSGTPADGHGHHQLAGYLTPLAFKAAADPKMFPEHFQEGLTVWQAKKLYRSQGFRADPNNPPSLVLNTGEYDWLLGRSFFEIAMEGRSQHKSQEMGVLELRGRFTSGMNLLESFVDKKDKETSVFDGIDTSIKGIAKLANDSNSNLTSKLDDLQETAQKALKEYDVYNPQKLIPILARGYKQAVEAEQSTRNPDSKRMLRHKQEEFAKALQMAAGVVVDALSDTETIVAGDSTNVGVRVFAPDNADVKVKNVALKTPTGWSSQSSTEPAQPETGFRPRRETAFSASFFTLTTAKDAKPTQPYWMETARNKDFTFNWNDKDAKNLPFQNALVTAEVRMEIGGQEITVEREVGYRYSDDIRGELRRNLNVVPAATVGLESNLLIAPTGAKANKHRLVMTVSNNSPREIRGTARFNVPADWTLSPKSGEFALKSKGEKTALAFDLTIPANAKTDSYKLTAVATVDGKDYDWQMQTIAYPHIQTHRIYSKAEVTAQVLDLKVSPVKIGYIMGSGDKVPQAIQRLGLNLTMLDEKMLSTGNLNQFDTIVVGVRASQVRPDYVANNGRLIEFIKNGGTLITQYQQQEYARYNLPPFPAKMDGNIRTTDENAPVKILVPTNSIFNFPNKITDKDFENWVQERNLYTLTSWDEKYTPLLETHDEGEPESKGGMLYAEIGKGKYIYTAYSWFRQLPVGNPGAYRIFANMLSLGAKKK
jgi:LmbE family N-acetylglucosaminyl deacetylase